MTNYKELYSQYVRKYDDTKRRMKARGLKMWDERLSREEFELMYDAQSRITKKRGSQKATDTEIISDLVKRQRTELSDKQAKALQKGLKDNFNEDWSIKQIHLDGGELLREYNRKLENEGVLSGKERQKLIGQAIFGSP